MRLLPSDGHHGWTPYAWLVYLAIPVIHMVVWERSPLEWALSLVGFALFLALYFRGYWLSGRRLLPVIGGILLLAMVWVPFNSGASVFFIYAAGFLGEVGRPAVGVRYLLGIVALLVLETLLVRLEPMSWIPAVVFTLLIGGVNLHFAEVGRANARLKLEQQEVERLAKLAERERIARDLHDLLGHTLSVITLKSELAAKLAERDPARAGREMREVEDVSRQALAEVRRAVGGYRRQQIGAELSRARVALEAAGIELEVASAPYDLAPAAESAVALALREAVTNVARHSAAARCRIGLAQGDGRFSLEVKDDGRGGAEREGSGLAGMRERLEELGGELAVDSSARGTRLTVHLPSRTGEALRPAPGSAA